MDIAKCTQDGVVYHALRFSRLPTAEIALKRHDLICQSCGNSAFFSKASRSGHAAHFGARHEDGCNLAALERSQNEGGENQDHDAIKILVQRLLLISILAIRRNQITWLKMHW